VKGVVIWAALEGGMGKRITDAEAIRISRELGEAAGFFVTEVYPTRSDAERAVVTFVRDGNDGDTLAGCVLFRDGSDFSAATFRPAVGR